MIETMHDKTQYLFDEIAFQHVLQKIRTQASHSENNPQGLVQEFQWLRQTGALQIVLPGEALDFNEAKMPELLSLLMAVGKANLSVGRIFEGHINTLYLIHLYADQQQRDEWYRGVREDGHLFGVWNTQSQNGIEFSKNAEAYDVTGSKTFCSGATLVNRALITGNISFNKHQGWQMVIIDMARVTSDKINRDSWKPLGMKASGSYTVDFSGYKLQEAELLGKPGIYLNQPHFSGGAIRFAAVHLGGAEAIADNTIQYLKDLKRTDDPIQRMRISNMMMQLAAGKLWLEQAGKHYDEWVDNKAHTTDLIAFANMTRVSVEDICLRIMDESNKCVGARGLMAPYEMERLFRDLSFYLRQPAPDATRLHVADYFINKQV
ncbi:acyl-CoA dehydrogenase family protein [Pedobacter sandarakinus]|uniref:acyl-CoA dehydrogenase family protein n=1 Tax=Pedobacter sandarakinus TaxID=353156 RepID=UPI0022454AB7|nr:acyl-CoA dehydrogenase family protein [Pedobacter sandarakinus]MCX2574138.1 acyl-CoA/acyl-ACP dehydrogenase [Pedobacter sandarakinus]